MVDLTDEQWHQLEDEAQQLSQIFEPDEPNSLA